MARATSIAELNGERASTQPIYRMALANERDLVGARQMARSIAEKRGSHHHDQIRIATAVSEIARNAYQRCGGRLYAQEEQYREATYRKVVQRLPDLDQRSPPY